MLCLHLFYKLTHFQSLSKVLHVSFPAQVVGEEPDPSSSRPNEGLAAPTNSVKDDFEVRLREVKEKYKDVPDRYKGYEILLDVYDDPHTKIPSGEYQVSELTLCTLSVRVL